MTDDSPNDTSTLMESAKPQAAEGDSAKPGVAESDADPQESFVDAMTHAAFVRTAGNLTVAVTGAAGFVGRHVCRTLIEHGHGVRALVRDPRRAAHLPRAAQAIKGDVFDRASLDRFVDKIDACIHLVGIIKEQPRLDITFERLHVEATANVVAACESAGVLRYVHMSALGARPDAVARYHRTKFEAEQIVRASRLPWTIFRPSLIHGPEGELTEMVARWVRGQASPFLFMPWFGAGPLGRGPKRLVQPIYIEDLAEAFARSIETERTVREVYPIGGPDRMTWPEMLYAFRDAIAPGSKKRALAIPAWKAMAMAKIMAAASLGSLLPFNVDQIIMSQEDSTCDTLRVEQHLGLALTSFAESLDRYASSL